MIFCIFHLITFLLLGGLPPFNVRPTFTFYSYPDSDFLQLRKAKVCTHCKYWAAQKVSLMNFAASCEQLKELCQGFTVTNWKTFSGGNVQQILDRTIGSRPSINQTLRRPLISAQNCNYFRALCRNEQTCWIFLQSQAATSPDNTCWEVLIERWCQTSIKLRADGLYGQSTRGHGFYQFDWPFTFHTFASPTSSVSVEY